MRARVVAPPVIDTKSVDLAEAVWRVDLPHTIGAARRLRAGATEALQRAVLESMLDFAGQAYTVAPDEVTGRSGMRFAADKSSLATKCWESVEHPNVLAVVLGFAGTRMDDPDDLMCDLKSQIPRAHSNPLSADLPNLGPVGSGWQERWQAEALAPRPNGQCLADLLIQYADMARQSGKTLSISVVGHSLGAAVATLASFDIAHFLDANGACGKVSTYAFNPPRLGTGSVVEQYAAPSANGGMAFTLRQFTRALDPIQSVPMFMHHPGWVDSSQPGTHCVESNSQVVTYQDRWADRLNLSANHELPRWEPVIASSMRNSDLGKIFNAPDGPWPAQQGGTPGWLAPIG
ncbi:XopAP family type III secretion system effector [Paracidovorax valerianellae]|uniref:Lipase (Class 3) n=1 Tax=Paracidovorax valerianellae TaxID=187868 RepID=A0A1G7DQS7_9BURK|nr:XopAP family type III secretion system effector [Paracidovorax valerianellae]MDA8446689.1 lipase [Paracidovorax valerianellae]SDE53510.1 Lipase (class 3) [Paracidovorax valerianellae]